jgi:transposase
MLYAGLDVHKNFCQAIVMTKDGEPVKKERINSDKEDIQRFFEGLGDVKVAFEASSPYEYFYDTLKDIGCDVSLSHPLKTRLIAESMIKTDKIDAKALADLLRCGYLPTSYVPPDDIRELRHLSRHRKHLGEHRTRLKNQIYAVLARKNLRCPNKETFSKIGIQWLRSLNNSEINSLLSIYDAVDREFRTMELNVKKEGEQNEDVKLLTTIPGIGWYSALMIVSEIGDINRFESEEKLYSYAGLIPSTHQTGDHCYNGRITKAGSKNLRWILVENVRVHVRWAHDTKITKFYQRMRKKKPENVAAVAAARKMLQAIYWMLKKREEYRG